MTSTTLIRTCKRVIFSSLLSFVLFFFSGCYQPAYVSNRIQAPLFSKANQGIAAIAVSGTSGIEGQLAYSPFSHLGVMGSYLWAGSGKDSNSFREQFWEIGLGGYDTLSKYLRYDIYAGYGKGKSNSQYTTFNFWLPGVLHRVDAEFERYSACGSLGFVLPSGSEYAIAMRYSKVHMQPYQDIQSGGGVDTVTGPLNQTFFEPAVIARTGSPDLKAEVQLSLLIPGSREVKFETKIMYISVGLVGRFDATHWFQ